MTQTTLTQSGAPGRVIGEDQFFTLSLNTITQCVDFVKIFNISLDFSTVYFAHFSGC